MDRDEAEELLRNLFADPRAPRGWRRTSSCPTPIPPGLDRAPGRGDRASATSATRTRRSGSCGRPCGWPGARVTRHRAADAMATLGHLPVHRRSHAGGTATPRRGGRGARRRAARAGAVPPRLRAGSPARPLRGELPTTCDGRAGSSPGPATRSGRPARSTCRPSSTSGCGEVESAAEAFAEYGEICGRAGRRWRSRSRRAQHRVAGLPPRRPAACARAVRRGGRALRRRRASRTSTSSSTRSAAYLSGGLAQDALAVVESRSRRPGRCSRASRPTCWWRWPMRPSPRTTGTAPGRPPTRARPCCAPSPGASTGWRPTSSRSLLATGPVTVPPRCCAGHERIVDGMRETPGAAAAAGAPPRCRAGEPGPVRPGRRPRGPTGSPRRRPTAARPPAPSGRSAGWRRPGRREAAVTPAVCCAPASSACGRSTSTRRPSAARSCGPGPPATVRPWPSSAPAPPWPAATPDSCCGGRSGGGPPPSPRRRAVPATTRRPQPTWRRCGPSAADSTRPAPTVRPPTRSRRVPLGSSSRCAAACCRSADRERPPRPSTSTTLLDGARRGRHGPRRAGRARRRPARARGGSRARTPPGGRRGSGRCRCRRLLVVHPAPGRARTPGPARGGRRPARARAARGRAGRRG